MSLAQLSLNVPRDYYGNVIKPLTPKQWNDVLNRASQPKTNKIEGE